MVFSYLRTFCTEEENTSMKSSRLSLLTFALITAGTLYADTPDKSPASPASIQAVDEGALDKSVNACDDFYQFACGGWLEKTEIPADRAMWSRGFYSVAERNLATLRTILDGYASGKTDATDPDTKKLGDYYSVCMDETKAETASLKTLQHLFREVDAIKNLTQLAPALAKLHLESVNAFFSLDSLQDFKDSSQMIAGADQGGIDLPDRDYYLKDEGKMPEIRKLYQEHMTRMFRLIKMPAKAAEKNTALVFEMEKKIAQASMSRVDRRNPEKVYHRIERKGLIEKAPHFSWDEYLKALGYPDVQTINVSSPEYFEALDKLLVATPIADIRTYLRWHLLVRATPTLGKKFVDERFRFTSKALAGEKEILPRWKRCVSSVDSALGHPLGRSYVKVTFGAKGKEESREIMKGIENSFEELLKKTSWMDDATRKEALEKLHKITNQVGYPDKWRNMDGLKVTRDSYLKNSLEAGAFNAKYELDKIGKPVDRLEWYMTPPTVNAYYSPENNQMVFPAGILQMPYFNKDAPDTINYGAIGAVMGHELTHGFDDQGRQFDARGNLRDWWTADVTKEFTKRADCMTKQFDGYIPIDDLHLNGKLTLGENIADQGGLKAAFQAYQTAKKKPNFQGGKNEGGFSDDQLFFLGYAQSWCSKYRPELARTRVTVDPHSPPKFRVTGAVTNFPEFAKVFSCKSGSKMIPTQSCAVW
jgi:putative endopeptidase